MEFDEIKHLIELLQETDITELKIEREGAKIKIKRDKFTAPVEAPPIAQAPVAAEPKVDKVAAGESQNLSTMTSPIVGMYYSALSPEAPPLVEVGSRVKKGQVLCIIEAMKLMNEIECDTNGTIAQILVENGQPVEYGEPLFMIEPAS